MAVGMKLWFFKWYFIFIFPSCLSNYIVKPCHIILEASVMTKGSASEWKST